MSGDRQAARSTAEALAADERAKNHHVLADRLQRALSTVAVTPPAPNVSASLPAAPSGRDVILERNAAIRLDELVLPLPAREAAERLIEEHQRADVLRAHGFEPRHRVLLSGPPGNGKTSFAEAIAEGLSLPFFVVRYDALVGSYLGETNARLRALFDYVRTRPSVLFFDEFDAIGKERGDAHETGEIKRVVSFLLMQLDQLPSWVVVVAATNHAELLDRAVWRRFELRVAMPAPDENLVAHFIERIVRQWPEKPLHTSKRIAEKLGRVSFAEALDFCRSVRRRHILGLGSVSIDDACDAELGLWAARVGPGNGAGEGGEAASEVGRGSGRKAGGGKGRSGPET